MVHFLQVSCLLSAIFCLARSFREQGKHTIERSAVNDQKQRAVSPPLPAEIPSGNKQRKPEGRRLRSHSADRSRRARASNAIAARRYNPTTLETTTTLNSDESFERAITHLAAAVGLGTEQLIYVRRVDIEEVVDALLRQAGTPGGLSVAPPTLERLAIVRQSAKGGAIYNTPSGLRSNRATSVDRRKLFAAFEEDKDDEIREKRSRNVHLSRTPPSRPSTCLENSNDKNMMIRARPAEAATTHTTGIIAAPIFHRSRSPVSSRTMDDTAARRRRAGWSGGEQRKSRQTRSPLPRAPPSPAFTSVASGASPTRDFAARSSTVGRKPETEISPVKPLAESRFKVYNATAAAASKPKPEGYNEKFPSPTLSPAAGDMKEISFVPITPRVADESAGPRAFDDFWSSGLVD